MGLILIVDDDNGFKALLAAAMSEMGHDVITAENGVEGLEAARANQPHLIISDIMMPEMDGVEFNYQLQEDARTKGTPVLMLTGSMDKHMEVSQLHAMSMSFEFIVGKMAPLEHITGIVRDILFRYYQF